MASAGGHLQMEMGAGGSFLTGVACRSEKRIVEGTDEQGGRGDSRNKRPGAVQRPVGLSVLETMDRAGITVIELDEKCAAMTYIDDDLNGQQLALSLTPLVHA